MDRICSRSDLRSGASQPCSVSADKATSIISHRTTHNWRQLGEYLNTLIGMRKKAHAAGLWMPHMPKEWGGMGLGHVQLAMVQAEAAKASYGPWVLNCQAPDEGNMHLLSEVATLAQKQEFLRPLATGVHRSCFGMTEPIPGAGSDPGMLSTQAVWDGQHYVISGRKWLITGAHEAGFMILMAQTIVDGSAIGATMFLVPLPHPACPPPNRPNPTTASPPAAA